MDGNTSYFNCIKISNIYGRSHNTGQDGFRIITITSPIIHFNEIRKSIGLVS